MKNAKHLRIYNYSDHTCSRFLYNRTN